MAVSAQSSGAFRVLFVCTGNICRSALAERLGAAYLADVLGDRAGQVQLSSAGTAAAVGAAMHPDSALVLAGFGGRPDGHVGRQLDGQMIMDSDLTLTMTRVHREDVLQVAPRALNRTFTLAEAASVLRLVSEDVAPLGADLPERGRRLVAALAAARGRRYADPADDIPDPIGRPLELQQQVGDRIAEAVTDVFGRLAALDGVQSLAAAQVVRRARSHRSGRR